MQEEQKFDLTNDSKLNVDFPVDLNSLFTLSYSFNNLKLAIEYLARQ